MARSKPPLAGAQSNQTAYKGHLIKIASNGDHHISKEGYHISTQPSMDAARKVIDILHGSV